MEHVSVEQMSRIDEKVPEDYGVDIHRMMENAGYQIADFVRNKFSHNPHVLVYVGKGNNGGDALAAARRLYLWNFEVEVVCPFELDGIRREEKEILENIGVEIKDEAGVEPDVIVDGLIGYNLRGDPRPPFDEIIQGINAADADVVSIDAASGLDADSGERKNPCVEPDYTVMLALPKKGLEEENSGELWVADISIPPEAYREFGFEPDLFNEGSLVRL